MSDEKKQPPNNSKHLPPCALQTVGLPGASVTIFVPDADAMQEAYNRGEIPFPYWSKVWPAAEALANFINNHPQYTDGKQVVELGAGLGLPSLMAAQHAATVLCTDHVPEAVAVAQQSALHHKLANFSTAVMDWNFIPPTISADVWLLSDINYEPVAFDTLLNLMQRFIKEGSTVLLSTPQRLPAKSFIEPLLPFCIRQEEVVIKDVMVTVMVLKEKLLTR